jgi:hypothetical protein
MAKRRTIGDNPPNSLIQHLSHNGHATAILEVEETPQPTQKTTKSSKQRMTVQISVDLIERLKNAVYWTPGLTLASLAEEAFSNAVEGLEKERKSPFPKRKKELKTGRPIS